MGRTPRGAGPPTSSTRGGWLSIRTAGYATTTTIARSSGHGSSAGVRRTTPASCYAVRRRTTTNGAPLVAELPVGEGLTDHVGTGAAWEPTERLHRETQAFERDHPLLMASVTVRKRSRSCAPSADDLFFFPAVEPGYEISAAAFAMK